MSSSPNNGISPLQARQLKPLTLANIAEVENGLPAQEFNLALRTCMLDLMDRFGDEKERTVNLSLRLKPILGRQGQLDSVAVQFLITHTTPKVCASGYVMLPFPNGVLAFHPRSPHDPRQTALEYNPRTGEITNTAQAPPAPQVDPAVDMTDEPEGENIPN